MGMKQSVVALLEKAGIIRPKEQMISYEVVYQPEELDAHGQWMSTETLNDACDNFNKNLKAGIVKANLFHLKDTNKFSIEDTWVQKEFDVDVSETGEHIKAGTWVAKLKYHDKQLWDLRKAGVIGGVSIQCKGVVDKETGEITNLSFDDIETKEGESGNPSAE